MFPNLLGGGAGSKTILETSSSILWCLQVVLAAPPIPGDDDPEVSQRFSIKSGLGVWEVSGNAFGILKCS